MISNHNLHVINLTSLSFLLSQKERLPSINIHCHLLILGKPKQSLIWVAATFSPKSCGVDVCKPKQFAKQLQTIQLLVLTDLSQTSKQIVQICCGYCSVATCEGADTIKGKRTVSQESQTLELVDTWFGQLLPSQFICQEESQASAEAEEWKTSL